MNRLNSHQRLIHGEIVKFANATIPARNALNTFCDGEKKKQKGKCLLFQFHKALGELLEDCLLSFVSLNVFKDLGFCFVLVILHADFAGQHAEFASWLAVDGVISRPWRDLSDAKRISICGFDAKEFAFTDGGAIACGLRLAPIHICFAGNDLRESWQCNGVHRFGM